MRGRWPLATIAECASSEPYSTQIGPFGDKIRADIYTQHGAPVLRGTNVNQAGRFYDDGFVFINPDLADTEFTKFVCEADDVILCHKGTLGKIGIIPKISRFKKYIMGNSMMKVRCDKEKLHPLFLYYWLTSREGQNYLFSRVSQVGVPQIQRPLTTLREAQIPLPPLPAQKRIAHILGTLDDKIELNRRMNETLEAMARALFKSWFIVFDPVRAKSEGRKPEGLSSEIAALFPDRFEESEIGSIPKGWKVDTVESLCDLITSGGTPARMNPEFWDSGTIPWFKTGELLDGALLDSEEHITELALKNSSCKIWPAGTILFALYASPTVGRLGVLTQPGASNQAAAGLVVKPKYGIPFLRRVLIEARGKLQNIAVGAAQQNINQAVLKSHGVVVPSADIAYEYSHRMEPFDAQQIALAKESQTLIFMRNVLLPRLINGAPIVPISLSNAVHP